MIKPLASASFLALMLSLNACTSFDLGPTGEAAISQEAAALDAPASWVFGPKTDGEIAANWSSVLNDPRLDELIDLALKNNISLRSSAENIARSEAFLQQSRSNLVPSLSADFGPQVGGALEGNNFFDSYSGGLSASWEADLWGGIRAGVLASGYDLASTRATFESARQALIAAVARSYSLVIEAEFQLGLSEKTLRSQEETLRIVNVRYDLGAASRREVVLAESDVAGARDNLVVTQNSKTDSIQALQILLGSYPTGELAVAPDFPEFSSPLSTGTPETLLRRRPDILSAEYDVLSAFQERRSTKADTWPRLSISGGVNTGSANIGDLLNPTSIAYSLGARLADTLFDGGFTEARIEIANTNQRQALAVYGQAVLDAYFDVETALNTIETLNERRIFVRQSAESARETLALGEIQYKEGAIDLIDVLTFRQRSFVADRTQITLERQIIEARIALYLALGGAQIDQG